MKKGPLVLAVVGAVVVVGGGSWLLFGRGDTPSSFEDRRAQVITHRCTSCGHSEHVTVEELTRKGWLAMEFSEGPVGDGRKCPRCGKPTMSFAREGEAHQPPAR